MVIKLVAGEGSDGDGVQRADSCDGGGGGKAMGTPCRQLPLCPQTSRKDFSARALGDHCEKSHTIRDCPIAEGR